MSTIPVLELLDVVPGADFDSAYGSQSKSSGGASFQAASMMLSMNESVVLNEIVSTLEAIEQNQFVLKEELDALKRRMDGMSGPERFERKLEEQVKAYNIDQLRLPARLHNATCHKYPNLIKAPPITPGKVPKNFPATRGEFEHLTKERYEGIMQEYGVPFSGDTTAKRETLRAFLGLPGVDDVGDYKKKK